MLCDGIVKEKDYYPLNGEGGGQIFYVWGGGKVGLGEPLLIKSPNCQKLYNSEI